MAARRGNPEPPIESLDIEAASAPPPAVCPRCGSADVARIGSTPSGLRPWRCGACRRIGYGDRVIGEPIPALARATTRRAPSSGRGQRFIRRPRKPIDPEDVP